MVRSRVHRTRAHAFYEGAIPHLDGRQTRHGVDVAEQDYLA